MCSRSKPQSSRARNRQRFEEFQESSTNSIVALPLHFGRPVRSFGLGRAMKATMRPFVPVLGVVLSISLPDAQSPRSGPQLSSARDRAVALQAESAGGPFHTVCTADVAFGSNVMTNCDSVVLPHNETAIAVEPDNPNHLVGGSNNFRRLASPRRPIRQ